MCGIYIYSFLGWLSQMSDEGGGDGGDGVTTTTTAAGTGTQGFEIDYRWDRIPEEDEQAGVWLVFAASLVLTVVFAMDACNSTGDGDTGGNDGDDEGHHQIGRAGREGGGEGRMGSGGGGGEGVWRPGGGARADDGDSDGCSQHRSQYLLICSGTIFDIIARVRRRYLSEVLWIFQAGPLYEAGGGGGGGDGDDDDEGHHHHHHHQ